MVMMSENKENFIIESPAEDSLREERRRTGRYVATVISIFVSLYGLYQALTRGTPEYAAFFLPALIMFFYVFWILYASRTLSKISTEGLDDMDVLEEIKTDNIPAPQQPKPSPVQPQPQPSTSQREPEFCRSYSIA